MFSTSSGIRFLDCNSPVSDWQNLLFVKTVCPRQRNAWKKRLNCNRFILKAWAILGSCYIESGNEIKLWQLWKNLFSQNPGFAVGLVLPGDLYKGKGEYEKSVDAYQKGIQIRPRKLALLSTVLVMITRTWRPLLCRPDFQPSHS